MRPIDDVRADFDEIAQAVEPGASGSDRFDAFLLSLIPTHAVEVLDVGCGLGRLTWAAAAPPREVVGIDVSARMLERARLAGQSPRVSFRHGDFQDCDFAGRRFDCIVSAAALHHMAHETAVPRMVSLLRPGGRLVIHDLRRNIRVAESLRAYGALTWSVFDAFARTGRPFPPRRIRRLWTRHGAHETYLSFGEARSLAQRHLPGATVLSHWLWRYTIIWDRPHLAGSDQD